MKIDFKVVMGERKSNSVIKALGCDSRDLGIIPWSATDFLGDPG